MSLSNFITSFPSSTPYSPSLTYSGSFFDFMTDEDLNAFTYTQITSGTAAVIDTVDTAANGVLQFSSVGATEDKGAQIAQDAAPFQLRTGKDLCFGCRINTSDADQCDWVVGLSKIDDTSLIASAPTDGIYFEILDGTAAVNLRCRAGSALLQLDSGIAVPTDATFIRLHWRLSQVNATTHAGYLEAWVNGTLALAGAIAGLPDTIPMGMVAAFQSGAAALTTGDLDYIGAFQTR